ncbi:Talin-1 [Exaiptasia diaphana]|nr:Talin-1 [Exaiptasia diaphana]
MAMNNVLENPVEPVNDDTYFDCLETVSRESRDLAESMPVISDSIKSADYNKFDSTVRRASDAVCALTESAAQAAYLVAVADPSSTAGRPGLIDQDKFLKARNEINDACSSLLDPDSSQQKVLAAATSVAKHTSALCNACKTASAKTTNPAAKRQFVQSAKDVANNTATLVKNIKTFAGNMNEDNRLSCADATKPLRNSVHSLTAYALSPEFASVPARISDEARSAQVPVIMAGKSVATTGTNYFNAAKIGVVNPKDQQAMYQMQQSAKAVADAMKRLITAIKDNAPGQRECDEALDKINQVINDLDQASLSSISEGLAPRTDNTLRGYQEKMQQNLHQISDNVDPLAVAAKSEPENIGHKVAKLTDFLVPLCDATIGTASLMNNVDRKADMLDQTKTVAECAAQMMYAAKAGGGNPKNTDAHPAIDEAAESMKDALRDLTDTVEKDASESGVVSGLVDSISKTLTSIDGPMDPVHAKIREADQPFVYYQERMTKAMKELTRRAQDMVGKSSTDPTKLGPLAKDISNLYDDIAKNSKGAVATVGNQQIAQRIRNGVQGLGESCIGLVQSGGEVQNRPNDPYSKKELSDNSKRVAEKVSHLLSALMAGSRGTQACINAAATVNAIVNDLDTTVMFATAGTMNPENQNDNFADHR